MDFSRTARLRALFNKSNKARAKQIENDSKFSSWSESFDKLLEDPDGVEHFLQYSESEYSSESIHFWLACEEYKKSSSDMLAVKASDIYEEYLSKSADNPINIDAYLLR